MKNKDLHRQIKAGGQLRGISGRNGVSVLTRRVRGRLRLEAFVYPREMFRDFIQSRNATQNRDRRVFWEDGTSTILEDDPVDPKLEKS